MSLELDLLRHGETAAVGFRGRTDDALTELGWRQMRAAVAGAGPWDLILSSPRQRCATFARELATECRLPWQIDSRFAELDFGDWEGKTHDELLSSDEAALRAFWRDPWSNPPTRGEPLPDFAGRVLAALGDLTRERAGQKALVVGHGGVLRMVLALARGLPLERLAEFAVPHGAMFEFRVEAREARWPSIAERKPLRGETRTQALA